MKCPNCGNRDSKTIESNGVSRKDLDYTLLCTARVPVADAAFERRDIPSEDIDAEGRTTCGMQWCPNDP